MNTRRTGFMARAFTLVELLVVISVISIGAALLVPAFGRISASLNYTGAINSVVATLGSARTLAIRENRHTAVAFLWDDQEQRMSLQVLVQQPGLSARIVDPSRLAGSIEAIDNAAIAYRPAPNTTPVILPVGTAVYGYALAPGATGLDLDSSGDTPAWYAGHYIEDGGGAGFQSDQGDVPLWLFPRNDASWATEQFATTRPNNVRGVEPWSDLGAPTTRLNGSDFERAVRGAQTFCIQFAPDGTVVNAPTVGGLTVINATIELTDGPIDRDDRARGAYDDDLLFDPESAVTGGPTGVVPSDPEPNREVVMRSANQLAVVEIARLREFTGLETPWRVQPSLATTPSATWVDSAAYYNDDVAQRVSNWIDANAEILGFNRYSGDVLRRTTR